MKTEEIQSTALTDRLTNGSIFNVLDRLSFVLCTMDYTIDTLSNTLESVALKGKANDTPAVNEVMKGIEPGCSLAERIQVQVEYADKLLGRLIELTHVIDL